ncbi:hypothetical protein ACEWY4_004737 [Coilia grayii]|uniref:MHD domain-containing protein n=1 Tax=Coilia grayii TaxID=363190 RepID=A0ABD1KMJ3_9TELE
MMVTGPRAGVPNMGPTLGVPNMLPTGPRARVPNMEPTLGVPNMSPTLGVPNVVPLGPRAGVPNMLPIGPTLGAPAVLNSFYSSSDSEEEEEPRKFHVEIKPVQPSNANQQQQRATIDELRASVVNITLSPSTSVQMRRNQSGAARPAPPSRPSHTKLAGSGPVLDSVTQSGPALDSVNQSGPILSCVNQSGPVLDSVNQSGPVLSCVNQSGPVLDSVNQSGPVLDSVNQSGPALACVNQSGPVLGCVNQSGPVLDSVNQSGPILSCVNQSGPVLDSVNQSGPALACVNQSSPVLGCVNQSGPALDSFNQSGPVLDSVNQSGPALDSVNQSGPVLSCVNQSGDELGRPRTNFNENKLTNNDLLSLDPFGPSHTTGPSSSVSSAAAVPLPNRPTTPLNMGALAPPPRPSSRPKLPAGKLTGITEMSRPFSPPKVANCSPPPTAPLARAESSSSLSSNASLSASNTPTVEDDVFIGKLPTFEKRCETPAGTSRGPSPVTLASQDALPIAVAFTESVNAYFKGADPNKCIVKITGDVTLSFPSGIMKVFTSAPSPAVLSFRLRNTSRLEQILPNQQLLHSDASQSDPNTKDFWLNMQALTSFLRKTAEQNPSATYYNIDILKYQVNSNGIQSTPLNLAVYWKCSSGTTDLRVDYRYNPEAMAQPSALSNVQVLVPVDGGVANMQSLPAAIWNAEQSKCLWKLGDISEKSEDEGSGSLRAKFELTEGPSSPATLAVQFFSEGSTLSGADLELLGAGYRLSLNKKRFATGRYMADC